MFELSRSCFVVRNDNINMNETTRSHTFEPFFTTKQERDNSNIDLTTVQTIVKRHANNIELENSPDRGTTIHAHFAPTF